jgi:hypothetical protein
MLFSPNRYLIAHWLKWLKDICGLRTNGFMVDCSAVEHAGIKAAFGNCRIYYCSFHIAQIWERHLKSKGMVHYRADLSTVWEYGFTKQIATHHLWIFCILERKSCHEASAQCDPQGDNI